MNETDDEPIHSYIYREAWPNTDYPNSPDPPFLAPFYAESGSDSSGSNQISYRILDLSDQSKPDNEQVTDVIKFRKYLFHIKNV